MSEQLKVALNILLGDLLRAGKEYLPEAYATGKAYAAAKSGLDIGAYPLDNDIAQMAVSFNSEKLHQMIRDMDAEILALDPTNYDSVNSYMADVNRVFNKYEGRRHAYTYYAEQPFFDGFIQGGKDIAPEMARNGGVTSSDIGFTWHTAHDEKVCFTCRGLDGQWFPLTSREVAWTAHIGCRCPEYFTYDPNPELEGGRRIR